MSVSHHHCKHPLPSWPPGLRKSIFAATGHLRPMTRAWRSWRESSTCFAWREINFPLPRGPDHAQKDMGVERLPVVRHAGAGPFCVPAPDLPVGAGLSLSITT